MKNLRAIFNDSCKDGGIMASLWNLYKAQVRLTALGRKHVIGILFFHGRGGTIGRGGGPLFESILAQPPGTVNGKLRITEQGEMLSLHYGSLPEIAMRHLEQIITATIKSSVSDGQTSQMQQWATAMDKLSAMADKCYRKLTSARGFEQFFEAFTPIDIISWLKLSSRPSRRPGKLSIKDLRAVPYNFAGKQNGTELAILFGSGHAFKKYITQRLYHLKDHTRHAFKKHITQLYHPKDHKRL
jgi:phosphoenolpyruvate carboxylase